MNSIYFLAVQFGIILIMGFATTWQNRRKQWAGKKSSDNFTRYTRRWQLPRGIIPAMTMKSSVSIQDSTRSSARTTATFHSLQSLIAYNESTRPYPSSTEYWWRLRNHHRRYAYSLRAWWGRSRSYLCPSYEGLRQRAYSGLRRGSQTHCVYPKYITLLGTCQGSFWESAAKVSRCLTWQLDDYVILYSDGRSYLYQRG